MNLLILDIDETLLFASPKPLQYAMAGQVGPYSVYLRPYLTEFLAVVDAHYEVAVWTSSGEDYAREVLKLIPFISEPSFVWSRERCTRVFDSERLEHHYAKDLKKVRRVGYQLDNILVVDDTPEKLARNYGNYLKVQPFEGDPGDKELQLLARYLPQLAKCDSVRSVEKRGWRNTVRGD